MRRIYLDHNASTPIAPEVSAVMREATDFAYGNPSSDTGLGPPLESWSKVPVAR